MRMGLILINWDIWILKAKVCMLHVKEIYDFFSENFPTNVNIFEIIKQTGFNDVSYHNWKTSKLI
jgi:hypothetical protein